MRAYKDAESEMHAIFSAVQASAVNAKDSKRMSVRLITAAAAEMTLTKKLRMATLGFMLMHILCCLSRA